MALTPCAECAHEISDKASTCPHCGCPVVKADVAPDKPDVAECRDCNKHYPFEELFCPGCGLMNYQRAKWIDKQEMLAKYRASDPNSPITCPACKAVNPFTTTNKGFGLGKAAVGGLMFGPVGLLGGFVGSNRAIVTCLKCGCRWKP